MGQSPVEIDNKRVFVGLGLCSVHQLGITSLQMSMFSLLLCPIASWPV